MSDIVSVSLILISFIIIIGFLSSYQFGITGFPGILFLILLGFLFGPVFNFVKPEDVVVFAPYLTVLATILILFEGGLAMNIQKTFRETPRAMLLTVLVFLFSTVAVAMFMMLIGFDLLYGALLGVMISGNSAAVIIPIVRRIQVSDEAVAVVSLESTLNNIFNIVSFLAIVGIITAGHLDLLVVAQDIAARFSVGAVIGLIVGVFWLNVLLKIKRETFAYMLTIAVLLLAYYASEYLGGNGALSSLLFGIVLGNEKEIFRIARRDVEDVVVDESMVRFESELAFLIRTFFFVYIGLTINVTNVLSIVYGVIISILLLLTRILATFFSTIGSPLQYERHIIAMVLSRGLSEAVLSVLLLNYGLPYSTLFQNIAFIVIIATNIICTVGIYLLTKRGKYTGLTKEF
ncbi:MAG: cation:proton antiporter [Candidatus Bathyarchaeota archaeon]|nr:cation:proton antiporter [Candidatus Bathyarchaeota archaeon]